MKTSSKLTGLALGASLACALTSCGDGKVPISGVSNHSSNSESPSWDQVVEPGRGFYDMALTHYMNAMDKGPAGRTAVATLFVNFSGALLHKEKDDGFLSCAESTMIAQASMSVEQQKVLTTSLEEWFGAAGAKIKITTTKPASGAFATIHIGTTWTEFGCTADQQYPARVIADPGNLMPVDHAVVFADMIPDPQALTVAVAHVAGHMFGAMHGKGAGNIMSGLLTNGSAGFTEKGFEIDGAWKAPATLPGMTQLSTIGNLVKDIKDDQKMVDLSRVQAEIQMLLPGKLDMTGLNRALTVIKLAEAAAMNQNTGPIPDGAAGGVSTAIMIAAMLNPELVPVVAGADALAKMAGYSSSGDALVAVINMALGQAGIGAKVPAMTSLPDIATVLGLQSLTSMEELVRTMNGHTDYVNKSFSGTDKQAMLALLKLAYSQAYNQLFRSTFAD